MTAYGAAGSKFRMYSEYIERYAEKIYHPK